MKTVMILCAVLVLTIQVNALVSIPVTGIKLSGLAHEALGVNQPEAADRFSVEGGSLLVVDHIHIRGSSALSVVDQPPGNAGYVSSAPKTLTSFQVAERFGSIGILAHNYLAGAQFFELQSGDHLTVEFRNKSSQRYRVVEVKKYQALSPNSPYSEFVNLKTGKLITAETLFLENYGVGGSLILQTCIEKDGVLTWGRLFVVAKPVHQGAAHLSMSIPENINTPGLLVDAY